MMARKLLEIWEDKGNQPVFMEEDQQNHEAKVRKGGGRRKVFPIRGFFH